MVESFVLYTGEKNISSWSMRAFVALVHKGVSFEERTIPLVDDKDRRLRRQVSPTGKVPVLHHGTRVIPDSLAILEYLEEVLPPPRYPALWPSDLGDRAYARWLAAAMHSGFFKVREHMSFNLCFLAKPPVPPPEALEEAQEMLAYWEVALTRKTQPGPFLFGPFGGVDAMYAPAVVRLKAFHVPTGRTPKAGTYMNAVLEYPAVKRWLDAARALPPRESY
jgi:glutathione S-transferase